MSIVAILSELTLEYISETPQDIQCHDYHKRNSNGTAILDMQTLVLLGMSFGTSSGALTWIVVFTELL